jgi:hypothetical protein
MDWRLKCLAFHTIARIPGIHRWLQRRLTGRYFLTLTDSIFAVYSFHLKNFPGGHALEFGAGDNLLCPLMLSHAGASEVLAIDLQPLASVDRINHVIRQLAERLPGEWPELSRLGDLLPLYRIRYVAPADMRATGLPAGSVDFICSTSTLEHIPQKEIEAIIAECRRMCSPKAVCSFTIDYHDHYATGDSSISRFNFYRYPNWLWSFFNPGMHFQNRLRHSDYVKLFESFEQIEATQIIPSRPAIPVKLSPQFRRYGPDDLVALNGRFILRPHRLT